tara:strand:- start:1027 stop:1224 length:198 start_codon:yes stop_codon:yes gene_type:complete
MWCQDYWVIKYKKANGTKHLQHIGANYKQYDVEKIKNIFNELHPEWEILKVYPIEKIKFKEPDGG